MGFTATLLPGPTINALFDSLRIQKGTCFFQKRSMIRPEIQDIYRVLSHGLTSWDFPDLAWVFSSRRKTIMYCGPINLAFRIAVHATRVNPAYKFHLYTSFRLPHCNTETQRLFQEGPTIYVILSSRCLKACWHRSKPAVVQEEAVIGTASVVKNPLLNYEKFCIRIDSVFVAICVSSSI
jgi:hypothetical protein